MLASLLLSFFGCNRLHLICQCEVELLALEIGARHLDADRITQLIFCVMASTYDHVILLVEVVVIIAKVANRNHALTVVLVYLGIDAV